MQVWSRPSEGTVVSLWIPAAPDNPPTGHASPAAIGAVTAGCRILVVDDDLLVLSSTADMLRDLGHEPIGIPSAKRALEILREGERPDLAILDYAMPEMTGAALVERVREICPGLPLLLATGYSERDNACADLPRLDKPFTLAELARQIGPRVNAPGETSRAGLDQAQDAR